MKKLLSAICCLTIILTLAACGKEEAPSDPNHIVIGDYELQYKGASIMTDSEGKDAVVLTMDFTNNGKDAADYLWSIYEKAMQDGIELEGAIVYVSEDSYEMVTDSQFTEIASGKTIEVRVAYTLRDAENPVEVAFTDLLEKYKGAVTIDPTTLTREGSKPEPSAAETDEPMTAAPTGDALLDWWNGDWYGWWIITGADGGYESSNNNWWDCCAQISIGTDYTGSVIIWDENMPKDNAFSEASVSLNSAGTGEYGTLTSEDGYFLNGELTHAEWIVDPGIMDYDDLLCIDGDGWYEDWFGDGDGSFHYSIYLRPWGTLWDDIAADDPDGLPYYYESWYLPLVNAGKAMPDTLGSAESSSAENQDGGQNIAGPVDGDAGSAATDDDYGKSNANAMGIAKLEDMQTLYKICSENRNSADHLFN